MKNLQLTLTCFLFFSMLKASGCAYCVHGNVANPATSFMTNSTCSSSYEIPLMHELQAKMIQYNVKIDWSMLKNIPPFDYNALINKPVIVNGTNGVNGIDGINGINGTDGIDGTDGVNATDAIYDRNVNDCEADPLLFYICVGSAATSFLSLTTAVTLICCCSRKNHSQNQVSPNCSKTNQKSIDQSQTTLATFVLTE